jgi:hypothetical protein
MVNEVKDLKNYSRMKAFEKELAVLFDEPEDDIDNDPVLNMLIKKGLIK